MKQNEIQKIALERIYRLFELAEKFFEKEPKLSKRYVALAKKISSKNKATIPWELKKKFCKKCGAFLKSEKNSKETKQPPFLLIKCLECGFERKTSISPQEKPHSKQ